MEGLLNVVPLEALPSAPASHVLPPQPHTCIMDAKGMSLAVLPSISFRLTAHKFTPMLFEPADTFCIHNPLGQ